MKDHTQICVLFDLDGTLVETDSVHKEAFRELLEPFGYNVTDQFYKEKISGRHNQDIFMSLLGPNISEEEIEKWGTLKESTFRKRCLEQPGTLNPLPGVVELLKSLKNENVPIICVTNAPRENAEFMLQALKVQSFFDSVVIGDECSHGKPHPAPYLEGIRRSNVSPEYCIAFEDSPSGIKSALGAGVYKYCKNSDNCGGVRIVIGVASTRTSEELKSVGAHYVVNDFSDLTVEKLLKMLEQNVNRTT